MLVPFVVFLCTHAVLEMFDRVLVFVTHIAVRVRLTPSVPLLEGYEKLTKWRDETMNALCALEGTLYWRAEHTTFRNHLPHNASAWSWRNQGTR